MEFILVENGASLLILLNYARLYIPHYVGSNMLRFQFYEQLIFYSRYIIDIMKKKS